MTCRPYKETEQEPKKTEQEPKKRGAKRSRICKLQLRCLTCPYYKLLWWCKVNKTRVESGEPALQKACSFEYSFKKSCSLLNISNIEFTELKKRFKEECTPKQWVDFMAKHGLNQGRKYTNQQAILVGMQQKVKGLGKKPSPEDQNEKKGLENNTLTSKEATAKVPSPEEKTIHVDKNAKDFEGAQI